MSDKSGTLAAGLRWLFDTEQPEGAVLQHHGVTAPATDNRRFGFIPAGWQNRAIVTVDVVEVQWRWEGDREAPTNPLRQPWVPRWWTPGTDIPASLAVSRWHVRPIRRWWAP